MKKLFPIVLVGGVIALVLYYLSTGGSLNKGGASGGKLPNLPKPNGLWDQLINASWFYPLLAATVVVVIIAFLWGKIGVWGQRAVYLVIGIIVAYVAVKGGFTK